MAPRLREGDNGVINAPNPSFRRKQESRGQKDWTLAFARVTEMTLV